MGKRAVKLEQRGLLKRLRDEQDNRILEITELATTRYFSTMDAQRLDVAEDNDASESGT